MREVLSESDLAAAFVPLAASGWTVADDGKSIGKSFRFKDFAAAFGWMTGVALAAEKADHHPEWKNVYNRVEVLLSTHSAGGITALDIALATTMDRLAGAA